MENRKWQTSKDSRCGDQISDYSQFSQLQKEEWDLKEGSIYALDDGILTVTEHFRDKKKGRNEVCAKFQFKQMVASMGREPQRRCSLGR